MGASQQALVYSAITDRKAANPQFDKGNATYLTPKPPQYSPKDESPINIEQPSDPLLRAPDPFPILKANVVPGDGRYQAEVYRDEVSISYSRPQLQGVKLPGKPRGTIKGLSNKSRRNAMRVFTRAGKLDRPLIITLTYPDEFAFHGFQKGSDPLPQAHQFMRLAREAFRKRMLRLYEGTWWFCRVEWLPRRSGAFIGEFAPHMHYICSGLQNDLADIRKIVFAAWHEILQGLLPSVNIQRPIMQIETPRNNRQLYKYVTKYVTKEGLDLVCIWLESCNIPSLGRHWTVFGDYTAPVVAKVQMTYQQFILLRRLASRWLRNKNRRYSRQIKRNSPKQGFSVFGLGEMIKDRRVAVPDTPIFKLLEWCIS